MKAIEAYDSAYPGSMSQREDGSFIRREDADSLAGALLALVKSGDRAAEDLQDALTEAKKDAHLYAKKDQDNYELRAENQRLKDALFFWLPNIPAVENECTERMANDAALLIGHEGRIDDSAEQRGWITLTPNCEVSGLSAAERRQMSKDDMAAQGTIDRGVRAQFEHWFSDEGKSPKAIERGAGGAYILMSAVQAWAVWQAAATAEREACAKVCDELGDCGPDNGCCPTYWNEATERAAADIRNRSN